eukprot:Opistho-1_new@16729
MPRRLRRGALTPSSSTGATRTRRTCGWAIRRWAPFLAETHRPIMYSCSWPDYERISGASMKLEQVAAYCNIWRYFDDIADSWASVSSIIKYTGDNQDMYAPVARPGAFNDADMLIIGNFGLNEEESKTQMAIWSIIASPLIMSNDLRNISTWARDILLNKEVIAVNQDPLGIQGRRTCVNGTVETWVRPLKGFEYAVAFYNNGDTAATSTTNFEACGIPLSSPSARDLFAKKDLGKLNGSFTATIPPHGTVMLRLTGSA